MSFGLGQVALKKINLDNRKGFNEDISRWVRQIDLFESILQKSMTLEVTLLDSHGLRGKLALSGGEILEVEFQTAHEVMQRSHWTSKAGKQKTIKIKMEVVAVTGSKVVNVLSEQYKIVAKSSEWVANQKFKTSGNLVGKCERQIQRLWMTIGDTSRLDTTKTSNSIKFVMPYWSPMRAIDWISARARPYGPKSDNSFIFYEDHEKYKFTNLAKLMDKSPFFYFYDQTALMQASEIYDGKDGRMGDFHRLTKAPAFTTTNREREISKGMLASEAMVIDWTRKNFDTFAYNYSNQFKNSTHLNENKLVQNKDDPYTRWSTSNMTIFHNQTQMYMWEDSKIYDHEVYESWFLQRQSILQQFDSETVKVSMHGNSELKAGDVVHLNVGSRSSDEPEQQDKMLSGKYIAINVRHSILVGEAAGYSTHCDLAKDSMIDAIPDSTSITSG